MSPAVGAEELRAIARERRLSFPIATKDEFVEQMSRAGERLTFRGEEHDTAHVSGLIPDFFFPLESEEDLLRKATELLMARGMLPLDRDAAR